MNPTTPWTNLMLNDFWGTPLTHSGSHKSYRPLCVLSFRLNYWLHELQPAGYHLFNVLLHCLATALFTVLARSLLPARAGLATAVAGCLFAAHPIHTEAVAGIVGRADVGAAVFFLLAFLSYRRYAIVRSSLVRLRRDELIKSSRSLSSGSSSHSGSHSNGNKCSNNNNHSSSWSLADPFRSFLTAAIFTLIKWNGTKSFLRPNNKMNNKMAAALVTGSKTGACILVLRKWMWLLLTLFFAACSMLTKEHGITVLAVCAVYDVFVHSRLRPRDIFSSVIFQVKSLLKNPGAPWPLARKMSAVQIHHHCHLTKKTKQKAHPIYILYIYIRWPKKNSNMMDGQLAIVDLVFRQSLIFFFSVQREIIELDVVGLRKHLYN